MSSIPIELDLSRLSQQLVANIPQAPDLPALLEICASYIDAVIPGSGYELVWDACGRQQRIDARDSPISLFPTVAQIAQLERGEIVDLGAEAACWVPLRLRGELQGWLKIAPAGLQPDQATALGLLAMTLGPTLASLLPETANDTRIEQLRTLNDIGQLLSGVLRIEELPETIYQSTCRVIDAPVFYIALFDEAQQALRLLYFVENGQQAHLDYQWMLHTGLVGVVVTQRAGLRTDHYLDECKRRGVPPVTVDGEILNTAWMCVPILSQDQVLGVITVTHSDAGFRYTDEQLDLLQTIAAQTSVAVANARLYERSERQTRQLDSLNRIGRSITSTLDTERVPSLIMEHVLELLEAEEGSLLLLDDESGDLVFAFAGGPTGNQLIGQRLPRGAGIAGNVFSTERATIVNNVREDGRFYSDTDTRTGYTTRTILAAPLRGVTGVQGVIEVLNKRGGGLFTEEDRRLIEAAADQAVIALENARRFAQIDQALTQRALELDRTNNQLREILQVGNALRVEQHLDDVLQQVAQAVSRSTGFRSAVIALVQRNQSDQPYLQRVAAANHKIADWQARVPLDSFTALLRPEFQRGPATYLIHHRTADYFALWNKQGEPSPVAVNHIAPGDWDPRDALLTVLLDNTKQLLGFLRVQDPVDNKLPTADQVQILEIFANQAAVAIENGRLYEDQAHSLRSLTALNALGMATNTLVQSEHEIFSMTARGVVEMSDALGACVLLNEGIDPGDAPTLADEPLVCIGAFDPTDQVVRQQAVAALSSNRPEVWSLNSETSKNATGAARALVAVPLRATPNTLGVLCVGYAETLPRPADLEMLTLFAGQAAAAVANLRLWRAVNRGRDQLASIMASTHDGILLVDPRGKVAVANGALYHLCYLSDTVEQQSLSTFLERWAATSNYFESEWLFLREGLHAVANQEQTMAHGQLNQLAPRARSLEWAALAARGEGDSNEGLLLIVRDITEAKEAERLRQDLTNMIVHDMRSPLTSVMTAIDMLFKGLNGPLSDTQRSVLNIAYTSSQQMLEMVNLMLDISRLESGRMPLERAPQPLGILVRRAISRISPQARQKEITIDIDIPEGLPLVYADGELIVRVLQNLIDNALKFSGRGSTIIVRGTVEQLQQPLTSPGEPPASPFYDTAKPQGRNTSPTFEVETERMVRVAVVDRGVGIAPKDQEKIFDKFGQVGERRGGTGLGLTFCKLVAEAHGGTIGISSVLNQGSTFFFTLPIVMIEG